MKLNIEIDIPEGVPSGTGLLYILCEMIKDTDICMLDVGQQREETAEFLGDDEVYTDIFAMITRIE